MTHRLLCGLAVTTLALAPVLAAAQTEQRTTGVRYADIDLATPEGQAELDRRIERAARDACGMNESQVGSRVRSREARACYDQARRALDRHFATIRQDAASAG